MAGVYSEEEEQKALNRELDDWGVWNCLRLMINRLQHTIMSLNADIRRLNDENNTLRHKINTLQSEDAV
mgnify:CR=1 FL=1